MTNHSSIRCRIVTACLLACVPLSARDVSAQNTKDVVETYKARAEVVQAAALSKQADAAIITASATHLKAQGEVAKLQQETRKLSAENDLLETRVFYDKRAAYHAYKEAHKPARTTPEQYAQRAQKSAPVRLASYQLWAKPGYIRWPSLLLKNDFAEPREAVNHLFAQRNAADSGAGSQNCVDLQEQLDELESLLTKKISRYKPADYLAAKRFIDSLSLEAQFPVDSGAERVAQK